MAELSVTVTVPNELVNDIVQSISDQLGYAGVGTRAAFIRDHVRDYFRALYIRGKRDEAAVAAADEAAAVSFV